MKASLRRILPALSRMDHERRRSGLFYCNLAIISYYDIVGFVDGDRSIISEDRQHCYAHAEIRSQETVAEDGFELIVVGAGILDAGHRLNWRKR